MPSAGCRYFLRPLQSRQKRIFQNMQKLLLRAEPPLRDGRATNSPSAISAPKDSRMCTEEKDTRTYASSGVPAQGMSQLDGDPEHF